MTGRIKTIYDRAPMANRHFDWCAYHDTDEGRLYGWGATKQEALDDLKRVDNEIADYKAQQTRVICGND